VENAHQNVDNVANAHLNNVNEANVKVE